ncbi:MAG: F0F1 ATP synthase subunit epsilon [bacterium]|nr:F0F1 ATP synthase subunit epsilon [bacterium]
MSKLTLKIITPEKVILSEEADQVTMMTTTGEITVLPHHIPLVTTLTPGELRYLQDGTEKYFAVSGGFAEIKADNTLSILADTAEIAEAIDLKRAEEAHARAVKTMEESRNKEDVDFVGLQSATERALNRVRVGNKYRKLPPVQK